VSNEPGAWKVKGQTRLRLGELADASGTLAVGAFVGRHPQPALVFVKGLPGQSPGGEAFDADDTMEFEATTKVPLAPRAAPEKIGPDAVVVFLEKRSPWTPFADVLTVGRATIQDVCIPLPSVSKFHVCLTRDPNGWRVTDERSINGTFVDGRRLDPGGAAFLRDGTRLGFGPAVEAFFFTPEGLHDLVRSRLEP
jgi:hypothetical protein